MAGKEHVQALMRAIGSQLDLLEVTEFAENDVWTLVVDETTILFADYDDERRQLVLSGDVGEPAAAGTEALHRLLLQYNDHWRETGGMRMALDPTGAVVQLFDLAVTDLELRRLQAVITGFVDALRAWREIVAKPGPATDLPLTGGMLGGMIRG